MKIQADQFQAGQVITSEGRYINHQSVITIVHVFRDQIVYSISKDEGQTVKGDRVLHPIVLAKKLNQDGIISIQTPQA